MSQRTLPVRLEGLIVNDDDVTPTLLNPLNGHIYVTNKIGKRVIEMCDGKRTVADIVRSIVQNSAVPRLKLLRRT